MPLSRPRRRGNIGGSRPRKNSYEMGGRRRRCSRLNTGRERVASAKMGNQVLTWFFLAFSGGRRQIIPRSGGKERRLPCQKGWQQREQSTQSPVGTRKERKQKTIVGAANHLSLFPFPHLSHAAKRQKKKRRMGRNWVGKSPKGMPFWGPGSKKGTTVFVVVVGFHHPTSNHEEEELIA